MAKTLDRKPVLEAVTLGDATDSAGTKFKIKIIDSGWGSSGYYPGKVLESDGPKVFHKGLQVYFDHPGENEMWDRPERSVNDIAGYLTTDAIWNDAELSLESEMYIFPSRAARVKELMETAGMSIAAYAIGEYGEIEGRFGEIFTELLEARSIDIVTMPGRGGAILSVVESLRATPITESEQAQLKQATKDIPVVAAVETNEGDGMDKETAEALTAALTAHTAALTVQNEQVATEAAARKAANEAPVVDPIDTAIKLTESLSTSELPKASQARVLAAVRAGETDVAKLIESEKTFLADVAKESKAAAPASVFNFPGVGTRASEAASSEPARVHSAFESRTDISEADAAAAYSRWGKS